MGITKATTTTLVVLAAASSLASGTVLPAVIGDKAPAVGVTSTPGGKTSARVGGPAGNRRVASKKVQSRTLRAANKRVEEWLGNTVRTGQTADSDSDSDSDHPGVVRSGKKKGGSKKSKKSKKSSDSDSSSDSSSSSGSDSDRPGVIRSGKKKG
eukprot:contig_36855_g8722